MIFGVLAEKFEELTQEARLFKMTSKGSGKGTILNELLPHDDSLLG
jgi:hypothetical protein